MGDDDDDRERKRVRYLGEVREPGQGWAQQEQFLRIVDRIGDEDDRLVKLLRIMRMAVMPRMLDERSWQTILMAAEAVLDFEDRPHEEPDDDDPEKGP